MRNYRFGRPVDGGRSIEYAPVALWPSTDEPEEPEYNAAGWYRLAIQPPNPPEGKVVAATLFAVHDSLLVAEYTYGDAPPRVRTFSKLRLEDELFKRGLLETLDAFVDAQVVTNDFGQTMPLRRKYDTANDFTDKHPVFQQFYVEAKRLLGLDDSTAEEILAAAEVPA